MNERTIDVACGNIKRYCAIKLNDVSCDGYSENMTLGVFSHFHNDHIKAISRCISAYDVLITHPITFEGINVIEPGMRYRQQWAPQDYGVKYTHADTSIMLLKANHIPGSAQVHVESDGKVMLYSGDFGFPDVQIKQADYLVIDSSHGSPWMDGQTDRKSVKNRMFEHVAEALDSKRVVVQVSSGTLQEIIHHFEIEYGKRLNEDVAFVMDKKQELILRKIYKHDVDRFREVVEYGTREFWDLLRSGKKCVIFYTDLVLSSELCDFYKVMIDRFSFSKENLPIIPFEGGCRFNLGTHASIDGIYEYIEMVNPKCVVTDYSRSPYAKQLAKLIEQKFPSMRTEHRPPYDL